MKVDCLRSTKSDNWFYLLSDGGQSALVDPVDAESAIVAVEKSDTTLQFVLNTHWHPDHVQGNDEVLETFPDARLLAGELDADTIDNLVQKPVDIRVKPGDTIPLGDTQLEVLLTPGHTQGHISFLAGRHLISGDVIFASGAGHCKFGGDPGQLFRTFSQTIAGLDEDLTFYPGHDYGLRNLEFALTIEPNNTAIEDALEAFRQAGDTLLLRTLGQERTYNPFMRFAQPAILQHLRTSHPEAFEEERARSQSDGEAVFRLTRRLRNDW